MGTCKIIYCFMLLQFYVLCSIDRIMIMKDKDKAISNTINNKNNDTTDYPNDEYLNSLVNNDIDVDDILDTIEKDLVNNDGDDEDEESHEDMNNENYKLFSKKAKRQQQDDDEEESELIHLQETFISNSRYIITMLIISFGFLYLLLNNQHKYDNLSKSGSRSHYMSMHDYKTKYEKEASENNRNQHHDCDDNGGYTDCRNQRGKEHQLSPDELSEEELDKHMDKEFLNELDKEEENFFEKEIEDDDEYEGDEFEKDDDDENNLKLPNDIENLADLSEGYDINKNPKDIAFFFHVPRVAGIVVEDIFSLCYNLVEVSQVSLFF